jgi:uncharacterized membrane protein
VAADWLVVPLGLPALVLEVLAILLGVRVSRHYRQARVAEVEDEVALEERVVDLLKRSPGRTLAQVVEGVNGPRRSVQRCLARLVREGRVRREGKTNDPGGTYWVV